MAKKTKTVRWTVTQIKPEELSFSPLVNPVVFEYKKKPS